MSSTALARALPTDGPRWARFARFSARASMALAVLLPVLAGVGFVMEGDLMAYDLTQLVAIIVVGLAPITVLSLSLLSLSQLMESFADGFIFTARAFALMRRFALFFMASCATKFLAGPILSVLTTLHLGPGERVLAVGIDANILLGLLVGFVFYLTASVMAEGKRLADETRAFV